MVTMPVPVVSRLARRIGAFGRFGELSGFFADFFGFALGDFAFVGFFGGDFAFGFGEFGFVFEFFVFVEGEFVFFAFFFEGEGDGGRWE